MPAKLMHTAVNAVNIPFKQEHGNTTVTLAEIIFLS